MKTIKIFLASSEELDYDRMAFGNLVRRLDDMYEKRGIRIKLFEWEDYDSAYNDKRKQDEYNDYVRQSDIFLALFHKKAGQFTIEEFDIASQEFKDHASPKVYTYCKDLKTGEEETPELKEFKKRLFDEMGHYWCRYDNRESLQFQFVMQLQLVETSGKVEKLKLEEGTFVLDGMLIAKIDNLQFAAGNEAYQKKSAELAELPDEIEMLRMMVQSHPDQQKYKDQLQKKLDKYNHLKDEFAQLQNALFETAQRIAAMQLEQVSDMLLRAIKAFEEGNHERANTLLDEIAHEAEHHMAQLESDRTLVHKDIAAFLLQAKTVMVDASIPIDERISKTEAIYGKADDWAQKSALPGEKYDKLLDDYREFLSRYAKFNKALSVSERLISLREKIFGSKHPDTATSYNDIGFVYENLGDYDKAMKFYKKALEIRKKILGLQHPSTARSYNNIGVVYTRLNNYHKALEYLFKAHEIKEKFLGTNHPDIATSYNNLGYVCDECDYYDMALKFYSKALDIKENVLGQEHPDTALSYHNIGSFYYEHGNYDKASEYLSKALIVCEKVLGPEHPETKDTQEYIDLVNQKIAHKGHP